tara:strand:+ start:373 stop:1002 length:630 start_codon:yes stop_codon:yes gene_type:complete
MANAEGGKRFSRRFDITVPVPGRREGLAAQLILDGSVGTDGIAGNIALRFRGDFPLPLGPLSGLATGSISAEFYGGFSYNEEEGFALRARARVSGTFRVGVGEDNETEVARLARNEGPHAMAAYAEAALYASGEVVFNSRTGMSGNVRFGVRSQDGYLMKILWFNRQGEADQGAVSVDSRVVSEVVLYDMAESRASQRQGDESREQQSQ